MAAPASPISPRLVRAGIVTMEPDTSVVHSIVVPQSDPGSPMDTLEFQTVAASAFGGE
jgi:hypothetical protein